MVMVTKNIAWHLAAPLLRKGWTIEKLYRKDGEFWVTLQRGLEGSRMPQDARKRRK
jgi:hypothetical protein